MFDIIIQQATSRFGLGDKAGLMVQMLLSHITNQETGGIAGFMSKLESGDLDKIAQSWMGNNVGALQLSSTQIESLFGGSGNLLDNVTSKLGIDGSIASPAIGFLLPLVIGKLTPNSSISTSLSNDRTLFITDAAPVRTPVVSVDMTYASARRLLKWLPWLVAGVASLFVISYFNRGSDAAKQAAAGAKNAAAMATTATQNRVKLEKSVDAASPVLSNSETLRIEEAIRK